MEKQVLPEVSRTFALNIPLLPVPARDQVTTAYLLLRIADTLEDAEHWPAERRIEELRAFAGILEGDDPQSIRGFTQRLGSDSPTSHQGYRLLLSRTPAVLESLRAIEPSLREIIVRYVLTSVEGMISTLEQLDEQNRLEIRDMEGLRRYCYFVAGLVGEMLTELFLGMNPCLSRAAGLLRQKARDFGEGLQLTNILKDSEADAREGRLYIPASVPRSTVVALARSDLQAADEYVRALFEGGAPKGFWAFAALPVRLARGTLAVVEERGPSAKLTRQQVAQIVASLDAADSPISFLSAGAVT
jgi:farnesyl-diphosphate farnesyltransferase